MALKTQQPHTPGKVFLGEPHVDRGRILIGSEEDYICEMTGFYDEDPADANAKRLVAAWNAFDGVPTEEIAARNAENDNLWHFVKQVAATYGVGKGEDYKDNPAAQQLFQYVFKARELTEAHAEKGE